MSEDAGDKWAQIEATAKARGKVSASTQGGGEKTGARGKKKGEAQRLSQSDIRRAQETLSTMSPSQMIGMLGVTKSALTPKQRAFAYNVALGDTGAGAYRKAYNCKGKPKTVGDHASRLKSDARIQAEIEAYQLAAEAAKHRTPADLRALVIQTLVSQVISPDTPPAIRTQAAKTLGQVTEVAAFTERRESVVHHSSDKIRADIFAQVQALMSGTTIEGERIEQDAASLMAELTATTPDETTDGPNPTAQDTAQPGSDNA